MAVRHRRRRNHGITRPVSRAEDLARSNIAWQIHCPLDVSRSVLLGDLENGAVVSVTNDETPEIQFNWQGNPPTEITLADANGVLYGPYPVTGSVSNVTDSLPPGVYSVVSEAENSLGELDTVVGTLRISSSASGAFDASHVSQFPIDASTTLFDASLVNGA